MEKDNYIKEKEIQNTPQAIDTEELSNLLELMKTHICKINCKDGCHGTGFFCNISNDWNSIIRVLITNNHVLNIDAIQPGQTINFTTNNDDKEYNIFIDNTRKIYTDESFDVTIIEIKKDDKIEGKSFFDLDKKIFEDNSYKIFRNHQIYLLHYPKGTKMKISPGVIKNISVDEEKKTIYHLCDSSGGSSGGPIINKNNFQVIGIHKGAPEGAQNYNLGTFLKEPIVKFNEEIKIKKDNIDNNKDNKEGENNKENKKNCILEENNKNDENIKVKSNNINSEKRDVNIEEVKEVKEEKKENKNLRENKNYNPTDFTQLINELKELKTKGNNLFKQNSFEEAIEKYKEGRDKLEKELIKINKEKEFNSQSKELLTLYKQILGNISLCYIKIEKYEESIDIELKIIDLDKYNDKSYVRLFENYIKIGNKEKALYFGKLLLRFDDETLKKYEKYDVIDNINKLKEELKKENESEETGRSGCIIY